MIHSALTVCGFMLSVVAAIFLARASWALDANAITQISATYWDWNQALRASLIAQAADPRLGVVLLVVGTGFQGAAINIVRSLDDFDRVNYKGALCGLLAAALIVGAGWALRGYYERLLTIQVEQAASDSASPNE